MSQAQVFRLQKPILNGCEIVEDEHCSGQLSMAWADENVLSVRDVIKSNNHLIAGMIAYELYLNH